MPNVEDFNFCPLGRIRHVLNQQKVRIRRWSGRKIKIITFEARMCMKTKETWTICPVKCRTFAAIRHHFAEKYRNWTDNLARFVFWSGFCTDIRGEELTRPPAFERRTQRLFLSARKRPGRSRFRAASPHCLRHLGPEAGVFVRLGSTNRRADMAQIAEMRRFGQFQSFDEQPIPDLNSEALGFRAASELFAPVRKLAPSAFRNLRVTTECQGREVPTVGGFLLFAKDRFDRFPDAWLQAGRFAGKDRGRILDSSEIRSHLPQAADQAISFVQKHLGRQAIITGAHRVDRWTVPMVALILDVTTGLRRSELFALKWGDIDFAGLRLDILRSIYLRHVGNCKTESSRKPVPLEDRVAADLWLWKETSPYRQADDWVFASPHNQGKYSFWPDAVLQKVIRPAALRAGITKRIGWHTFRHTFSTLLIANGENVKVVQELMRHASSRCALEFYSQAEIKAKRQAQPRLVQMILPDEADKLAPAIECNSQVEMQ